MSTISKLLVLFGLLWAITMPVYLFFQNLRDEQSRQLHALASARLGVSEEDYATNQSVRGCVELLTSLAQAEDRRSTVFAAAAGISSGFIVMLAFCILTQKQKHHCTVAEPCTAPNGGPATPLGNSGAGEGPPSVS